MRTRIIALAAVFGLATIGFAGELDQEFKSKDVKVTATAPASTPAPSSETLARTELDGESPIQAGHGHGGWGHGGWGHGGWGHGGWGHGGWGHHHGWGWGVSVGYGWGWGGWGRGYYGWSRPYYGYYGSLGYGPSYYYPYYSYYYPSFSVAFRYPGWGHHYW